MTNKLIKFYKGYLLVQLHNHLTKEKNILSICELDEMLKEHAGFEKEASCSDMTIDELQELISWSFDFGDHNGLFLNYPNNEWGKISDNEEI